jgi:hypothetical protein
VIARSELKSGHGARGDPWRDEGLLTRNFHDPPPTHPHFPELQRRQADARTRRWPPHAGAPISTRNRHYGEEHKGVPWFGRLNFPGTAIGGPAGASMRNVNQFKGSAAIAPAQPRPLPAVPHRVRSPPVSEFAARIPARVRVRGYLRDT